MTVTASSPHGTVATTEFDTPVRRRARARWRSVAILALTMVAAATLATVAGALVVSARDVWFDNLQRPGWVPTASGFLITATVIYATLGLAGWRIWVRGPGSVALTCWLVLLGLHLAWTVLFFGLWVPRWSLIGAAALGLMAIVTLVAAFRTTRLGTWLLVPDLVWVGYLIAVNAVIVAWN
jgi:tryptophan-rich sensory protein